MSGDLTTERMRLRGFTEADADWLAELHGDPAVMRFITGGKPEPAGVVRTETLHRFLREHAELRAGCGHVAAVRAVDGVPIGWFGLRSPLYIAIPGQDPSALEVGYRLFPTAWNQGYATEGTRALVRLAFTSLGAEHVLATTMTVNIGSRRVMEKAGLTLVRTFYRRWPGYIAGAEFGDVIYAVTRPDWLRRAREDEG